MSMMYHLREITNNEAAKLTADPEQIEDFLDNSLGQSEIDLEKAWHGIHYLLTGDASGGERPHCYLMDGGSPVGDIDVGYGPAMLLSKDQVKEFSDALGKLSEEQLKERFDPEAMDKAGVYPGVWDEGDEAFEWLFEVIDSELKPFFSTASQNGNSVLLWMD